MVYCMSDIHGENDRFNAMLELIQFTDCDTLYILGDVIDRKSGGIEILRKVMTAPNIHMILGNHEQMCIQTLGETQAYMARQLWEQNGGGCTRQKLMRSCSPRERRQIIRYLQELPDHQDIVVGDRKFHLVHAWPADNTQDRLWRRPPEQPARPFEDRVAIVGHTPTCYMRDKFDEPFTIWFGDGVIDIDCGCGNNTQYRRLACLRLDDMAEYYV